MGDSSRPNCKFNERHNHTPWTTWDAPTRPHNPKAGGSNPSPATSLPVRTLFTGPPRRACSFFQTPIAAAVRLGDQGPIPSSHREWQRG